MNIDLVKYLPLITAILSATLGYFFGIRTKKNDRLLQFAQESLNEIYSPMYHELLEVIPKEVEPKIREQQLDNFFKKYINSGTPIYKLGHSGLLNTFYELNNVYNNFKKTREEKAWIEFWWALENELFSQIKEGYNNLTNLLYRDFYWQQYIQSKPYWMKFYFESMKFLLDTSKGVNVVLLLMVYFSGFFKLFGLGLFPADFLTFSLIILSLSIVTTTLLLIANIQYVSLSTNSRQSIIRKILKKIFPNLISKWDNFLVGNKNYDNIPKIHRFLEERK